MENCIRKLVAHPRRDPASCGTRNTHLKSLVDTRKERIRKWIPWRHFSRMNWIGTPPPSFVACWWAWATGTWHRVANRHHHYHFHILWIYGASLLSSTLCSFLINGGLVPFLYCENLIFLKFWKFINKIRISSWLDILWGWRGRRLTRPGKNFRRDRLKGHVPELGASSSRTAEDVI